MDHHVKDLYITKYISYYTKVLFETPLDAVNIDLNTIKINL